MKLDFLTGGGGGGSGSGPAGGGGSLGGGGGTGGGGSSGGGSGPGKGSGGQSARPLSRGLIERYMRDRLDVTPLDDARRTIRVGVIATGAFFTLFLLFALLAPISGAALATGQVSTSGDKMLVQPASGGIVAQVLVREGQTVRAGQPLIRLNGVRSGAQLQQAQARRDALRALEARLIAERDGHERLAFPPDLVARADTPSAAEAMGGQRVLFERRRSVRQADRSLSDTQLVAARARTAASQQQLALIKDELAGISSLYARGFARKTTLRALQRSAAQLNSDIATGTAAIQEAEINRRRTLDGQFMDIAAELSQAQEQLAQINPQLEVSRYAADQDVLRATVDGRVAGVAQTGPGAVVGGGTTLMEIVPDARSLVVEARVQPEDIDDVHMGAEATVSFSSVNPRGQSDFKGRIVTLSPTRIEDGQGGGYYRAQVVLDDPGELTRAGVTLQPGVPASIAITTQRRSLWNYLVAPLSDAMSRAFREE